MHAQGPVRVYAVQGAGVDSVQPLPDPGHSDGEPGAGLQPPDDPPDQVLLGAGDEPHVCVGQAPTGLHSEGQAPHRARHTAPVLVTGPAGLKPLALFPPIRLLGNGKRQIHKTQIV